MSRDFKEFYDWICMQKRLLQTARAKPDDHPKPSLYEVLATIEKMIREGTYRHETAAFERALKEITDGPKKRRDAVVLMQISGLKPTRRLARRRKSGRALPPKPSSDLVE